jgi:hypothetical protein
MHVCRQRVNVPSKGMWYIVKVSLRSLGREGTKGYRAIMMILDKVSTIGRRRCCPAERDGLPCQFRAFVQTRKSWVVFVISFGVVAKGRVLF